MLFAAVAHLFWGLVGGVGMGVAPLLGLITGKWLSTWDLLNAVHAAATNTVASPAGRVVDLWLDLCFVCWCIYCVARVFYQRGWTGAWQHWALLYLRNGRELEHHATHAIHAVTEWQARLCFKMAAIGSAKKKEGTLQPKIRARSPSSPAIVLPLPALPPAPPPVTAAAVRAAENPVAAKQELTCAEFITKVRQVVPFLSDEEFRARYTSQHVTPPIKRHALWIPPPLVDASVEKFIDTALKTLALEGKSEAISLFACGERDGQGMIVHMHT